MSFQKQTIRDVDVRGKRVLLRADYNVPVKKGVITNDYRIKQSLPTVQYLVDHGAKVIICSHLGRPDGKRDLEASLFPVAKRLDEAMPDTNVNFVDDCVGDKVAVAVEKLKSGEVLLLENLRFYAQEEKNDQEFSKKLAAHADIFVQDGFGVVHRAHASTEGVTHFLPSVAGLLLDKEVRTIQGVMQAPDRPLMAIIGGAKISDKIEIIHKFIEIADFIAIGGAMANTFLKANGLDVAKSLIDSDDLPLAKQIMEKAKAEAKKRPFVFYLPQDGVVAKKVDSAVHTRIVDWSSHVVSTIENYPKRPPKEASHMHPDEMILDIGPVSASFIAGALQLCKTAVWNGTMGVTETKPLTGAIGPFAHGSETVVQGLLGEYGNKPFTVVGGGDTVGYVESLNLVGAFNHVSTGGGASLELMSGRVLPGVAALHDIEMKGE